MVFFMNSIVINLKRASIELILLSLLKEEDKYGYQLAQEIKKRSDNNFSVLEGSMYTILNRLKESGDVTFHNEIVGKKMTRVYYHITEEGLAHLEEMEKTFNETVEMIKHIYKND